MAQTAVAGIFAPVLAQASATTTATCCTPQMKKQFLLHAHAALLTTMLLLLRPHSATASLSAISTSAVTSSTFSSAAHTLQSSPHECGSIDVRNECQSLLQLRGCTVIKGYLIIVLLPKVNNNTRETCDYKEYRFPQLREITDYLMFFDVKGLTTIRDLFPNLTVIRGRRLFLNYALGISNMPDLELLEFKSLVAIQRGHVYIGSCPKLCHLEKINWDRMTLAPGENHVYPVAPETCPPNNECKGCDSDYCWSNLVCQKFENDNVVNLLQGSHHCNAECLGGCYNNTKEGCVVCRGWTDHGACMEQCPEDKYMLEQYQRCYTQQECVQMLGYYTHGLTCTSECPDGFVPDETTSDCVPCTEGDTCIKYCQPQITNEVITVFNLEDADRINGCQVLNGSLVIAIRNVVNERDLLRSMGKLREIRGHLKIYRSPHLTSLKFLQNLEKISGDPLENDLYALIIYDNKHLKALWDVDGLTLERGGMYVHLNNKLCNSIIRQFRDKVVHDKSLDSIQTSDQEVLCDPARLMLETQVVSHNTLKFIWRKKETSDEIEVLYRPSLAGKNPEEDSELDSNVCTRINWLRRLVFRSDLQDNGTHYSINISGLAQFTQYSCLVKTFGRNEQNNARSTLQIVRTKPDKPTPPQLAISKRTDTSLTFQLLLQNNTIELIDYYILDVFEHAEDQRLLDMRNFCEQPTLLYQAAPLDDYASNSHNEDYDDCCARQEAAAEDRQFVQQMQQQFSCSLNAKENCEAADAHDRLPDAQKPLQSLRLESNATMYTIHHLERFRLYSLNLQACNNEVGCGSYSVSNERTNYSTAGDKLEDLQACRVSGASEYHVFFAEPPHPNGLIVSYVIHYRLYLPQADAYQSHINCVTRMQHAASKYRHVATLNGSYNEVAVRVHSLAGDVFIPWVNVTLCRAPSNTKLAGIGLVPEHRGHGGGVNVFLIFFMIGAGGTVFWICYKRRYWRKLPEMRRYFPLHNSWRSMGRTDASVEDRQILVDGFETVRFHNNPDDDQKYLE